ncbi:unnamed protein product [Adineta ricciae]|uniref:Uncharacterized protein n=1 Tax=Adineta ricciae TaxID=249248 RepID=A0A814CFV4_ADIRI|nr:unnamed protein product [Adineta ricciae]
MIPLKRMYLSVAFSYFDLLIVWIFFLCLSPYVSCRVSGLFAVGSFTAHCYEHEQQHYFNSSMAPQSNLSNSYQSKSVNHTTTLYSQTVLFRAKVMPIIRWLCIIGVVICVCSLMEYFVWSITIKRQTSRMNVLLFRALLQRNMAYLDTNPISHFNTKFFLHIEKIEKGIGFDFLIFSGVVMCIFGSLVVSFITNWKLSLIILCVIPICIGSSLLFAKFTANETSNELKTYSRAGHIVQEVFSSLKTVHALNGSKFEQNRYEKELKPTRWSNIRKGAIFGIYNGWLSFISYLVYSVGFIFGVILMSDVNQSSLSLTDVLVIVTVSAQCVKYFSLIGPFFQAFSEAQSAAASIFPIIDDMQNVGINEVDVFTEATSNEESDVDVLGDIEFSNVSFVYPSRKNTLALSNLNLCARANQTTALVGLSGCGKSTCISLLLRLYDPSAGRITIDGRSLADYHVKQLRQHIGVVSQEPILFGMSIYENIRLGKLNATRAEIETAAKEANTHEFIMQLPNKYATLVGERGIQLSGGEKQRVALARALVKQPKILLLDEATSALDNINEKIVQEALDRACKNRTTIVIAHRLSTIQNADQIYVLDKGCVVEEGTHRTLMKNEGGTYQQMVNAQQTGKMPDNDLSSVVADITQSDKQDLCGRFPLSTNSTVKTDKKTTSENSQSIFRRLLMMNSPEWISILIGCIACIINGLSQPLFAILLAEITSKFDDCNQANVFRKVLFASFLFFLLGILVLIMRFIQYGSFAIAGSKLTQRIRSKAFACLLRQEVAYFDQPQNSSGAICIRLASNAAALQDMAGTRLGFICEAIALSCFGLLFGLLYNFELTIIVAAPFFFLMSVGFLDVRLRKWWKKRADVFLAQANALVVEAIHNMRTVKPLSIEKELLRQYSDLIYGVSRTFWIREFASSIMSSVIWALDSFIMALLYWRALVLVENHELPTRSLIMVFAFAMFALQALRVVGMLSRRISASISAAEVFFDLFDRKPLIDNTSDTGHELVNFRGEITFDRVHFVYPARPTTVVLNKLQLDIKSGQRIAIVGASGCGKSTIIQLLERFYDVTHGQLFFDGVDIQQLNLQWLRSRLGLVSQEPILFDLSIAENITYGLENIPMSAIIDAAKKANIHDFIQELPKGYETKVGMKGTFLSGGEKQRIAIARVLLRRPKILLLDETTSAMDSLNEQIVQQALDQAQVEDSTRTSIIIAHRLSTIRSCDRIYVLDKGHVVESGTHTELIQNRGVYYNMLSVQNNS